MARIHEDTSRGVIRWIGIQLPEGIQERSRPRSKMGEDDASASGHHSYGRQLRNTLGLWDPKSKWSLLFNSAGIFHADDMSGIIVTSLHRRINGKEIKLEEQIKHYQAYWIEAKAKEAGVT